MVLVQVGSVVVLTTSHTTTSGIYSNSKSTRQPAVHGCNWWYRRGTKVRIEVVQKNSRFLCFPTRPWPALTCPRCFLVLVNLVYTHAQTALVSLQFTISQSIISPHCSRPNFFSFVLPPSYPAKSSRKTTKNNRVLEIMRTGMFVSVLGVDEVVGGCRNSVLS